MADKDREKPDIHYDALGNILGLDIPKYNRITHEDDLTVIKAKREAQQQQWGHENP